MSEIKVNKISPKQTCTQLTLGDSGDTIIVTSGANFNTDAIKNLNTSSIITQTNATTITLGYSGSTIAIASGATQTGFGRTGAVNWDTTAKTTTVTAVSGVGYFVDTTTTTLTVNLPVGAAGDIVAISDYANTAATNNIIIDPNSTDKIQGVNSNYVINVNGGTVTLVYVDSTQGWRPTDAATSTSITPQPLFTVATGGTITTSGDYKIHSFTGPGTFCVSQVGNAPTNPAGGPNTVSYLVVAGGGAVSGGAGGYREGRDITPSYTASPLVAPAGLPITATSFPITVGAGASAAPAKGSNSIFSTITSTGGGSNSDKNGGSGAGANNATPGTGNTPPVSPSQGFPGGPNVNGQSNSGGGGALEAGAPNNGPNNPGGRGGVGTTTSITGSPLAYSGGGGGPANPAGFAGGPASPCGTGGQGSGNQGAGTNGTTNRGGGGVQGGSGIVVIRYKFQ